MSIKQEIKEGFFQELKGSLAYHYIPTFIRQQYEQFRGSSFFSPITGGQFLTLCGAMAVPAMVLGELTLINESYGGDLADLLGGPITENKNFLILGAAVVATNVVSGIYEMGRRFLKNKNPNTQLEKIVEPQGEYLSN